MRKILLFSFLFIFGMGSSAEAQKAAKKGFVQVPDRESMKVLAKKRQPVVEATFNGKDVSNINFAEAGAIQYTAEQASNRTTEEAIPIGSTFYDLQVNTTMCRRLAQHPGGQLSATWTMSQIQAVSFDDRGTGYNHWDGGWNGAPLERLETTRTGWPNLGVFDDGNEIIASHVFLSETSTLNPHVLTGAANTPAGLWDSQNLDDFEVGALWMRLATSGNTVHMIGLTTPVANGGVEYNGVDGHLLYFRSQDGGLTWDKTWETIPGLDSTNYIDMPADAYSIDANDNGTVAFGLWNDWGNTEVYISNDAGDNWTRRIVLDHPLDKYDSAVGYTLDDITIDLDGPAGGDEPSLTDSMAVRSTDNSGTIIVDPDGKVHAAFGEYYYSDIDFTDDLQTFYTGWSGILYWNSDMPDNEQVMIGDLILDPNDTTDSIFTLCPEGEGVYNLTNLTSFPMFSLGTDGIMYVTYAALQDNLCSAIDDQNIRHISVIHSLDGGATWSEPYDVVNEDTYEEYNDPGYLQSVETVYPSTVREVDDKLHIIYMQDGRPGQSLSGDEDPIELNLIYYVGIDKADIVSGVDVLQPEKIAFNVYPNPAVDQVNIAYTLTDKEEVEVSVMNIMGQEMTSVVKESQAAGSYNFNVNVQNYPAGVYLVQINTGDKISTQKLIVE